MLVQTPRGLKGLEVLWIWGEFKELLQLLREVGSAVGVMLMEWKRRDLVVATVDEQCADFWSRQGVGFFLGFDMLHAVQVLPWNVHGPMQLRDSKARLVSANRHAKGNPGGDTEAQNGEDRTEHVGPRDDSYKPDYDQRRGDYFAFRSDGNLDRGSAYRASGLWCR